MQATTTLTTAPQAAGDAHRWSVRWCALLERILAGRAAAGIDRSGLRGSVALVVLPSFSLVDPQVDLGRKGRAHDGTRLRFPARIVWSADCGADGSGAGNGAPVVLVPAGGSTVCSFEVTGVGVSASGSTLVSACAPGRHDDPLASAGDGFAPEVLYARPMAARRVLAELDRICEDGRLALWEARQMLERHAEWMLRHRHAAVAAEISPERDLHLLDATDLEVVRTELLLGDPAGRISPAYDRIIERCLAPSAFARVDPQRRVMTSLRSVAESAIRRRIGDPHVGRKVRRLLREETFAGLAELLACYRERWPGDAIGMRRVAAAVEVMSVAAPVSSDRLDSSRAPLDRAG